MNQIDVRCDSSATGWRCAVTIDDGQGTSAHEVTVAGEDATDLAAAADTSDVERLVYETVALPPRTRAQGIDPAHVRSHGRRPLLPRVRAETIARPTTRRLDLGNRGRPDSAQAPASRNSTDRDDPQDRRGPPPVATGSRGTGLIQPTTSVADVALVAIAVQRSIGAGQRRASTRSPRREDEPTSPSATATESKQAGHRRHRGLVRACSIEAEHPGRRRSGDRERDRAGGIGDRDDGDGWRLPRTATDARRTDEPPERTPSKSATGGRRTAAMLRSTGLTTAGSRAVARQTRTARSIDRRSTLGRLGASTAFAVVEARGAGGSQGRPRRRRGRSRSRHEGGGRSSAARRSTAARARAAPAIATPRLVRSPDASAGRQPPPEDSTASVDARAAADRHDDRPALGRARGDRGRR